MASEKNFNGTKLGLLNRYCILRFFYDLPKLNFGVLFFEVFTHRKQFFDFEIFSQKLYQNMLKMPSN